MSERFFLPALKPLIRSDPFDSGLGLQARLSRRVTTVLKYVLSSYYARLHQDSLRSVQCYSMLIGHTKSGGSLLGSLLDAHHHAVFGDEVDVLRYVALGFSREQIFYLVLALSRKQAMVGRIRGKRSGDSAYAYDITDQWQGGFDSELRLVGDSKAGLSTQRLGRSPELLPRLQRTLGDVNLRIIHLVRNPYDVISVMMMRSGRPFDSALQRYFANCASILALRAQLPPSALHLVRYETLVVEPRPSLLHCCDFLGLETTESYLESCTRLLYHKPVRSRNRIEWDPQHVRLVQCKIDEIPFLEGYSYDGI